MTATASSARTTAARRTMIFLTVIFALFTMTLVNAPAAKAGDTAASMGATCFDGGIRSGVTVVGGPDQKVATKYFVQKYENGRWETVAKTKYSVFRLTGRDWFNNGTRKKFYRADINKSGYYRVWTLVWFWNPNTNKWYGKTWVKPTAYNYLINGQNIYAGTPYCKYS